MTDQQIDQIKSTLKSLGWKYIREIIDMDLKKFDEPISYNRKDMEEVGKEYVARVEAKKKLEKIIKKIESYNKELRASKTIYK